ncbi:MAG: hypothetical protein ACRDKT_00360 [Actinomycetota bacterium]
MRKIIMLCAVVTVLAVGATPAAAHPHVAENSADGTVLADGQNHPGFAPINEDGLRLSCDGVLEPADSGPAGYGLETAHHGPDAGTPGSADGCFAVEGNPTDDNPGIN